MLKVKSLMKDSFNGESLFAFWLFNLISTFLLVWNLSIHLASTNSRVIISLLVILSPLYVISVYKSFYHFLN